MPASRSFAPSPGAMPTSDRSRRRLLTAGAASFLVLLLPACSGAGREPLRVAAHVWPGYELMFLARSLGWLDEGQVRLIETRNASDSLAALYRGEVDGAALTLDEVLRARAAGIPLVIVTVFNVSAGADVVMARPALRSLKDLAGKRIGVETTAQGALMLHKTLGAAGLLPADVAVVPLTADTHLAAWDAEGLDAVVTYEPVASRLEAVGARRLFDSRAIPDTIFDVLAIRRDALGAHEKALRHLIGAHFRGLRHLRINPRDAAHRMAARLAMPAGQAHAAFRGLQMPTLDANRQLLAPGSRLVAAALSIAELLVRSGDLPPNPDLTGLADGAYLPKDDS